MCYFVELVGWVSCEGDEIDLMLMYLFISADVAFILTASVVFGDILLHES